MPLDFRYLPGHLTVHRYGSPLEGMMRWWLSGCSADHSSNRLLQLVMRSQNSPFTCRASAVEAPRSAASRAPVTVRVGTLPMSASEYLLATCSSVEGLVEKERERVVGILCCLSQLEEVRKGEIGAVAAKLPIYPLWWLHQRYPIPFDRALKAVVWS